MRATTQRGALLETLGKVKSAVAVKHTLPVLGAVLIRATSDNNVWLSGTNLEVTLQGNCKANVSRPGAVAVLPKTLEAFLKAAKAETVTLSRVGKSRLKVEAGAITTLEGFEAKDYPSIPGVKGKAVEVTGLASGLKQISYAMSKDDARPVFNGVCLTPINGSMSLAATDGFRLAETKVKAKGQLEQAIMPARAVQILEKLMPGKVSIHKKANNISFVGDGMVMTAMVIQGTYPDYKNVIPSGGSKLIVDKKALNDALGLVAITLPDNGVVRFRTRAGNLVISTNDESKGKTEARVPAKGRAKIAFNYPYVKDILGKAGDTLTMRIKNAQTPGVVRQNGTIHVLMPMSVQW